jgi:hypothetical protein
VVLLLVCDEACPAAVKQTANITDKKKKQTVRIIFTPRHSGAGHDDRQVNLRQILTPGAPTRRDLADTL